jgi:predicted amidohydrolase
MRSAPALVANRPGTMYSSGDLPGPFTPARPLAIEPWPHRQETANEQIHPGASPDGPRTRRPGERGEGSRKSRRSCRKGARLVCLPELFATPYFCQSEEHANFDLAQPVPGPITESMAKAARSSGVTIVVPLFEKRAPGVYHNSLVVIGPEGQVLGHYRKMHIPDDPGFYEKFYFSPGDLGFMAVDTPVGHVGTLICWDQWFPEAARLTSMAGAILLVYPTAIGWHPAEKEQFGMSSAMPG